MGANANVFVVKIRRTRRKREKAVRVLKTDLCIVNLNRHLMGCKTRQKLILLSRYWLLNWLQGVDDIHNRCKGLKLTLLL